MTTNTTIQFPAVLRDGGGSAGRGTLNIPTSVSIDVGNPNRQPGPHSNQRQRYIVERGGGSSGTAYNKLDHEVLDRERPAGARIVARACGRDARLIAWALNQAVPL